MSETIASLFERACAVMGREAALQAYECGRLRVRVMFAAQRVLATGVADAETNAWIHEHHLDETGGDFITLEAGQVIYQRLTRFLGPAPERQR